MMGAVFQGSEQLSEIILFIYFHLYDITSSAHLSRIPIHDTISAGVAKTMVLKLISYATHLESVQLLIGLCFSNFHWDEHSNELYTNKSQCCPLSFFELCNFLMH